MPLKRYACPAHPGLRIGSEIHFREGFFQTNSEVLQRKIQQNDLWGARIIEIPAPEGVDLPAPKDPEMLAAVDAILAHGSEFDIDFGDTPEAAPEATPVAPDPDIPWHKKVTATDIGRMNKTNLMALFKELGGEPTGEETRARLQMELRQKLGV
jgi:hypothetical protein